MRMQTCQSSSCAGVPQKPNPRAMAEDASFLKEDDSLLTTTIGHPVSANSRTEDGGLMLGEWWRTCIQQVTGLEGFLSAEVWQD